MLKSSVDLIIARLETRHGPSALEINTHHDDIVQGMIDCCYNTAERQGYLSVKLYMFEVVEKTRGVHNTTKYKVQDPTTNHASVGTFLIGQNFDSLLQGCNRKTSDIYFQLMTLHE